MIWKREGRLRGVAEAKSKQGGVERASLPDNDRRAAWAIVDGTRGFAGQPIELATWIQKEHRRARREGELMMRERAVKVAEEHRSKAANAVFEAGEKRASAHIAGALRDIEPETDGAT